MFWIQWKHELNKDNAMKEPEDNPADTNDLTVNIVDFLINNLKFRFKIVIVNLTQLYIFKLLYHIYSLLKTNPRPPHPAPNSLAAGPPRTSYSA